MILYRGTNVKIDYIDLEKCKPYRDFGKGFYCTTIKKQAENMAERVVARRGGTEIINVYELDENIFNDKNIKVKQFNKPSAEWAKFVLNNRNRDFEWINSKECNVDCKYDLVIGPVADDDIISLFKTFERRSN